jgi:hypothetical protein
MAVEHRGREGNGGAANAGGHTLKGSMGLLTLGALGVVYGDIGTSPLYSASTTTSPPPRPTCSVCCRSSPGH